MKKDKETMTLNQMKRGQKAKIVEMDDEIPLKLVDLGCTLESEIEILHIAPLNDPIFIRINDTNLSVRRELAQLISVELL